jgi:hypothetical protein
MDSFSLIFQLAVKLPNQASRVTGIIQLIPIRITQITLVACSWNDSITHHCGDEMLEETRISFLQRVCM